MRGGEEEREGQEQRRQRKLLERAGVHSQEEHVHCSLNSVSVTPRLGARWSLALNERIKGNSHKDSDVYW